MNNNIITPPVDLPIDVLGKIGEGLELLDFLRFGSVCTSWRNSLVINETKPKPQIPWLMLYSPADHPDFNNDVHFFSLTESKTYKFQLPDTMRGFGFSHFIGSSEGFLLSVHRDTGNLLAANPLTGQHLPLPPTSDLLPGSSFSETPNWDRFHKAIVCPSTQAVVLCYGEQSSHSLAFALPGQDTWTTLGTHMDEDDILAPFMVEDEAGMFDDFIFHKGRLHAVCSMGMLWVYDLYGGSTEPCIRAPRVGPLAHEFAHFRRYLVDDPVTDDLYLVFRDFEHGPDDCPFGVVLSDSWTFFQTTTIFRVFKLDLDTHDVWNEIHSLGDVSLFLGFNRSLALSARAFPYLRSNRIYFTDDVAVSDVDTDDETNDIVGDMGVFSLEDGTVELLDISDDVLRRHNWPPPLWFSPTRH